MPESTCRQCGTPLTLNTHGKHRAYCQEQCRREAQQGRRKAQKRPLISKQCPACGETFQPTNHSQVYCPPTDKDRTKVNAVSRCAKKAANHKARGTPMVVGKVGLPFVCAQCAKRCVPGENVAHHATRFCGQECKAVWHREHEDGATRRHEKARRRRVRRARARVKLTKAAVGNGRDARHWVAGPCRHCGNSFVGITADARYCSDRCGRRAERWRNRDSPSVRAYRREWQRKRERQMGWRGQFPVSEVGERDHWVCQICGHPVDTNAEEIYDDLAPTVDHVVPLSLGGPHTLDNVQLAHFICNSAKRDIVDTDEVRAAVEPFLPARVGGG